MLTVACVLKSGGVYDREDVSRLEAGVKQWLPVKYRFVCLSDTMPACNWIHLEQNWRGWWSKMELFDLEPPVLYFDLDTIITGDLTEIAYAAEERPFIALRDFYREKSIGSGMMAWATDHKALYRKFALDAHSYMDSFRHRGDQGFIEGHIKGKPALWQDILPGQVCSYKADILKHGLKDYCRVVCFHGKPKPRDIGWMI